VVTVTSDVVSQRVLGLFADILEYPETSIVQQVRECESLVSATDAEAAALLRRFLSFVEETSIGDLQETYTAVFDLDADCHPYLGYQLFGEGYERSEFLLELKQRYRAGGFQANETELPDRISEVLRFLSVCSDRSANEEILQEGMIPALDKLTTDAGVVDAELDDAELELRQLRPENDPYRPVLHALLSVLEPLRSVTLPAAGVSAEGSPGPRSSWTPDWAKPAPAEGVSVTNSAQEERSGG
jgi:nitrate reductase delta subunit